MSKLIILNAKNATEVLPGTFQCELDTAYLSNIKAMALKSLTFVNNAPNVSSLNNVFTYEIDDVEFTETIDVEGYYTTDEVINLLVAKIQAQLDISSPGDVISITHDSITNKISILNTGTATMKYIGSSGSLNESLGNKVDSAVIPAGTTYIFTGDPDFLGLKSVTVSIRSKTPKTILNASSNKALHTNSLGMVPVTVPYLALQTFTQPDIKASSVVFDYEEDLTQLQFKLRDQNGNILPNTKDSLAIELVVWHI